MEEGVVGELSECGECRCLVPKDEHLCSGCKTGNFLECEKNYYENVVPTTNHSLMNFLARALYMEKLWSKMP